MAKVLILTGDVGGPGRGCTPYQRMIEEGYEVDIGAPSKKKLQSRYSSSAMSLRTRSLPRRTAQVSGCNARASPRLPEVKYLPRRTVRPSGRTWRAGRPFC
jgi:hypothetical protein